MAAPTPPLTTKREVEQAFCVAVNDAPAHWKLEVDTEGKDVARAAETWIVGFQPKMKEDIRGLICPFVSCPSRARGQQFTYANWVYHVRHHAVKLSDGTKEMTRLDDLETEEEKATVRRRILESATWLCESCVTVQTYYFSHGYTSKGPAYMVYYRNFRKCQKRPPFFPTNVICSSVEDQPPKVLLVKEDAAVEEVDPDDSDFEPPHGKKRQR